MITTKRNVTPPTDDKRWKIVDATIRRNGARSDALIETLHTAQECFGFLDCDALRYVAASLQLPLSKVYGVATFYHFFTLEPKGEHTCVVCMGTACYIRGASTALADIEKKYKVKAGQTTADNKLSVLTARCIGTCGLAPAVVFDGTIVGKLTSEDVTKRIEKMVSTKTERNP